MYGGRGREWRAGRASTRRWAAVLAAAVVLLTTGCRSGHSDGSAPPTAQTPLTARTPGFAANALLVGLDVAFTVDVTVTGWNTWHSTGTGETAPGVLALDMPGMPLMPHWLYA